MILCNYYSLIVIGFVRCNMISFPGKRRRRCEGQIPWRFAQMISPFLRWGGTHARSFQRLLIPRIFLKLLCSTPVAYIRMKRVSVHGHAFLVPRCQHHKFWPISIYLSMMLVLYQWPLLVEMECFRPPKVPKSTIDPWVIMGPCSKGTFKTTKPSHYIHYICDLPHQ